MSSCLFVSDNASYTPFNLPRTFSLYDFMVLLYVDFHLTFFSSYKLLSGSDIESLSKKRGFFFVEPQ